MIFRIKQGNREPALKVRLLLNEKAIPLAGASVKFIMRLPDAAEAKVSAVATVNEDGSVTHAWGPNDTDTEGTFNAEWQITFANGNTQTVPNEDYDYVEVGASLG